MRIKNHPNPEEIEDLLNSYLDYYEQPSVNSLDVGDEIVWIESDFCTLEHLNGANVRVKEGKVLKLGTKGFILLDIGWKKKTTIYRHIMLKKLK